MKTGNVERLSRSLQPQFEFATPAPYTCDQGSVSALVGMGACGVAMLLMLAACSPAHAQVLTLRASGEDTRTLDIAVALETLTVTPSPEDVSPPVKDRWQRFRETLNRERNRNYRIVESATNDGIRMSCYEPCILNCCTSSGEFSLAVAQGFGR